MPTPTPTPTATTMEGALMSLLTSDAGVAALVAGRIHPTTEPPASPMALPKLTYTRWGTGRGTDDGGFTNDGATGRAVGKVQVNVIAADLLAAKGIAAVVRRCLNGYSGVAAGVAIGCVRLADEREQPQPEYPGQERPVQLITLDFRISHQEQL